MRAQEARAPSVGAGVQGGGATFGLLFAAMGLMVTAGAIYGAARAGPFSADKLMGAPVGLMFVFAGFVMALPPHYGRWRILLGNL